MGEDLRSLLMDERREESTSFCGLFFPAIVVSVILTFVVVLTHKQDQCITVQRVQGLV